MHLVKSFLKSQELQMAKEQPLMSGIPDYPSFSCKYADKGCKRAYWRNGRVKQKHEDVLCDYRPGGPKDPAAPAETSTSAASPAVPPPIGSPPAGSPWPVAEKDASPKSPPGLPPRLAAAPVAASDADAEDEGDATSENGSAEPEAAASASPVKRSAGLAADMFGSAKESSEAGAAAAQPSGSGGGDSDDDDDSDDDEDFDDEDAALDDANSERPALAAPFDGQLPMGSYEPGGKGGANSAVLANTVYGGSIRSIPAATKGLNGQIDAKNGRHGFKDKQYAESTFKAAVVAKGFEIEELDDISETNTGFLKTELNRHGGMFIVGGVINNEWYLKNLRSGKPCQWEDPNYLNKFLNHPNAREGDDVAPGIDDSTQPSFGSGADTGWHHLIAISNGNLLDFDKKYSVNEAMWLGDDNQPDPTKGYMRTIRKVWRITKKPAVAGRKRGRPFGRYLAGIILGAEIVLQASSRQGGTMLRKLRWATARGSASGAGVQHISLSIRAAAGSPWGWWSDVRVERAEHFSLSAARVRVGGGEGGTFGPW